MRGKAEKLDKVIRERGITPAHAGKSRSITDLSVASQDHPRACGEKSWWGDEITPQKGSPPRMRGKACSHAQLDNQGRITPAHAGKRGPRKFLSVQAQDHPRACGEKTWTPCKLSMMQGSPPRMRGKGQRPALPPAGGGITPAHAGKSCAAFADMKWHEDHPRACGEKRPTV